MVSELYAFDQSLFVAINSISASPAVDAFFLAITNFGSAILLGMLALAMIIQRQTKQGFALLVTLATAALSVVLLKTIFLRPRPFEELAAVNLLTTESDSGFPSGHSASAFAAAGSLGKYYRFFKPAFYGLAVIVAFSRIYLGVHYPSDVIVGSLVGLGAYYLVNKYVNTDKFAEKAEKFWDRKFNQHKVAKKKK